MSTNYQHQQMKTKKHKNSICQQSKSSVDNLLTHLLTVNEKIYNLLSSKKTIVNKSTIKTLFAYIFGNFYIRVA
jgi:hypothetical protein